MGITMTYAGFLLGAMAADYYPRLTEVIANKSAAVSLMNDQAQLCFAIGGPVLLMLIGWAPWVIRFLYSEEFTPAVGILQWQPVGSTFKLASWPLGFSLATAAKGKTFLFAQINFNVIFLAMTLLGIPSEGLYHGPAFTVAYSINFTLLMIIVSRSVGYRMAPLTRNLLGLHAALSVALLSLAMISAPAGLTAAPVLAVGTAVFGLRAVLAKTGPDGKVAGRLTTLFDRAGWPIRTAP
ncbi:hypothetical protein [Tropicimonas sp. IMCC34011]|uniref:hypothetical protein n=1 Tax=Tropicimonas sp. IMCC34011 TaxID=2248759 RepID=UPI001E2AE501|nr:hypothetical protein [Tropicimonas sp. IMCC34011]